MNGRAYRLLLSACVALGGCSARRKGNARSPSPETARETDAQLTEEQRATEKGSGTKAIHPPAGTSQEIMETIERMQAAGRLTKIEVDRYGKGAPDLVLWCKDDALVKLEDLPHIEKAKIDLPPTDAFDRIVYREWGFEGFSVEDPGEIALFCQSLKEASVEKHAGSTGYFGQDGEDVVWVGTGEAWSRLGNFDPDALLFMKGDQVVCEIRTRGREEEGFKMLRPWGYDTFFVNRALPILLKRFVNRARERTRKGREQDEETTSRDRQN